MTTQRLEIISFFTLLGLAAFVAVLMVWPFIKIIAFAGILAVLFLPVQKRIRSSVKSEPIASFLTILFMLIMIILPLWILGQLMFNEVADLVTQFREGGHSINRTEIIQRLPETIQPAATNFINDIGQRISSLAGNAFQGFTNFLTNFAGFVLAFFLTFFTAYYLMRDEDRIKTFVGSIFPLSTKHENLIITKLENAISGVVKGAFLVALIQSAVATVGFLIFGVPVPFLWGAFTLLAALVPTVGTAISIVPAIVYLLATGSTGSAIGLAIWGALAVGMIDNIISPKLIGSRTNLHPLLVLFSVLGGIQLFGVIGFLLGPILMAAFVTLLDIYRTDLKEHLEK